MVAFPNLRTPPKLRTPTKLSISFTRRSTPRPTPRSARGGRVRALIDKFNGVNHTSDKSININTTGGKVEQGGDISLHTETLMPAKDKSLRSSRVKSFNRPEAFLSMGDDEMIAASDNCDSKNTASDGPAFAHKLPSETAREANKVEKAVDTLEKEVSAADDSSIQSFTTSSFESIDVKKLPSDRDDDDKENDFVGSEIEEPWLVAVKHFSPTKPSASPVEVESAATARVKGKPPVFYSTSQIDESWLVDDKHFVPKAQSASPVEVESAATARVKGNSPVFHSTSQIDESWLVDDKHFVPQARSASPVEVESVVNFKKKSPVLQERHVDQQKGSDKVSSTPIQQKISRRFSIGKLEEKDMIETICVAKNIKSSDIGDKRETVIDSEVNAGSNKITKLRNSTINAITKRSQTLSPYACKPPLDQCNKVQREQEAPIGGSQVVSKFKEDYRLLDKNNDISTKIFTTDEHDLTLKSMNQIFENPSHITANDLESNAHSSTAKSSNDQISTIGVVQNLSSSRMVAPVTSEAPLFYQHARSAMIAAGINPTATEFLPSNSGKQNVIDDDLMVTMTNGSECETFEVIKTRSIILPPQQQKRKGRKTRKSPFHEVARNALSAAEMTEQKKHNQQNLGAGKSIDVKNNLDNVPVVNGIVEVSTVKSIDDTDANVENGDDDDVEEEIFLGEIGMNNTPPPAAATLAEECTVIVNATSSTSSRNEAPLPDPTPAALPSQPPKVDNAQLLMPYLVSYGTPTQAPMPYYQYYYPGYYMHPQSQTMQYLYYPPFPPPPPPPTSDAGTIYIHI